MAASIRLQGYKSSLQEALHQCSKAVTGSHPLLKRTIYTTMKLYDREQYWNDRCKPDEAKFNKVLIANRGEIACRVINTCRRLGIKTVAVHSEADSLAVHTRSADEAICIGPAPSSESYLRMDKILQAIKDTGAEAVHPGYGFLSENTTFAAKLQDMGVAFVGPNSESIKAMGDKIESKRIAEKAGVNLIPGFDGAVKDADHCIELANKIGYPVMIKASAGGGGKGMRIARNDQEARTSFRLCTEEAKSSFGDDRMLIEKYIENPRHIEIQVLCDKHGNSLYLHERECSIQRRNQKVIEEAPSTFLDEETRKAMGDQACRLANAVGYDSAGTVEFLVDKNKNFYFLEMNTRLQVEHPITEMITGVDIVHQMLRVAKGHRLLHAQENIPIDGWAIECRVYAEDPFKNFGMPSIGRLSRYVEPLHIANTRCDSGIMEGSEISIYYDPMICKLVTYGRNRGLARETMIQSLDSYVIKGVTHNIPLLRDILTEKRFVEGDISTNYLPEVFPDGFKGKQLSITESQELAAMACAIYLKDEERAANFINMKASHIPITAKTKWALNVMIGKTRFMAQVARCADGLKVTVGDNNFDVKGSLSFASPLMDLNVNGEQRLLQVQLRNSCGKYELRFFGTVYPVQVMSERAFELSQHMLEKKQVDTSALVMAPMPGLLKTVSVAAGDLVAEHQEVCVLEAMKMQNSLVSAKVAKVKKVNFKAGDTVNEGDVIVELE
ncbi:hypothetical protein EGW08_008850 [Elysia chlorotica]|uniref:Uncharacterized protein n=1 Tax=Elysia chlorotica TaxID=188477 RepID=A0A3S1BGY3_ELYCH|nr:hypothetical protein EGW08_008850 [Elysia chlorotica]